MKALAFSGGKDSMACLHLLRDQLDCAIYVDTGMTYPETDELVGYAATLVPMHIVSSDRKSQNAQMGLPSDLVPIEWTLVGQMIGKGTPYRIQSSWDCCYTNIAMPLFQYAHRIGVDELVCGERKDDTLQSSAPNGTVIGRIVRRHPIADWTAAQVLEFLETKMEVPEHYRTVMQTSLDCFDCTGFGPYSHDRVAWMATRYPDKHQAYHDRMAQVRHAVESSLVHLGGKSHG